jgi:GntR family transcriptional regulator, frlABCD operon transcriptional regulator
MITIMNILSLDLLSTEPLYVQLKRSIRDAIVNKHLKHMERLPTEAEMRSIFGISTTVVRRAYDALVEKGLIIRIKGSGTYVNQRPPLRLSLPLFEAEFPVHLPSQIFCLDKVKSLPSPFQVDLAPTEKKFWLIKRLFTFEAYPVIYQTIYLPMSIFPKLQLRMDQSFSLIQFLKEINSNDLGPLKSKYITKKADASEAFILQTDLHAPLHYVLSTLMDADGKPLAFVQSYMDGKQVSLHSNPVFVK